MRQAAVIRISRPRKINPWASTATNFCVSEVIQVSTGPGNATASPHKGELFARVTTAAAEAES